MTMSISQEITWRVHRRPVLARNAYEGLCYKCSLTVRVGEGHFELVGKTLDGKSKWRTLHANFPGDGRVTCSYANARAQEEAEQSHQLR